MTTIGYDRPVTDLIAGLRATGHVTPGSWTKTSVTFHHNAGRNTHQQVLNIWKTREASAHFDVDAAGAVAQYANVGDYAWATGNRTGNQSSISIELCNSTLAPTWGVADVTWKSGARLAGWLFAHVIKQPPTAANVKFHSDWLATECPGPYMRSVRGQLVAEVQAAYRYFTGGPVTTNAVDILARNGIDANAAALLTAAQRIGLPLWIAAAFAQQESRGRNIYGHDAGGAYSAPPGTNITVTEANFAEFLRQVRAGKTSNGVGPMQITYKGYFPQAAAQGIKLWVPLDNFVFGLNIVKGYLGGKTDDTAITMAGRRYNSGSTKGGIEYGDQVLAKAKRWRTLLTGANTSTASTPAQDLGTWLSDAARRRLQTVLHVEADGVFGPGTLNALLVKAGYGREDNPRLDTPSNTIRKVQKYLNGFAFTTPKLTVDGVMGKATAAAVETYLLKKNGAFTGLDKVTV